MKNYLCINGKKIDLPAEALEEIRKSLGVNKVRLGDLDAGDTFKIFDYEFIVLEQTGEETKVILKDLLRDDVKFGAKNNDYRNSNILPILDKFAHEIERLVGIGNLIEHEVDLTADDGLKDYGTIEAKASLLTADMYRRYVDVLDMERLEKWYWLATPFSTKRHDNECFVKCVSPLGCVGDGICSGVSGVRPFCILNSNIFVS